MNRKNFNPLLYFIADPSCCLGRPVADVVAAAVRGGVTAVQLRDKSGDLVQIKEEALAIQLVLEGTNIPFILNDHAELAAEINADGVHIGQEDLSADQARKIIGPDKILGLTAFTPEHFTALDPLSVDYVGTGPFFPTLTKPDKAVLGFDKFSELVKNSPVPVIGIGGITPENAAQVMMAGAHGVAMMRSISESEDPCMAARELLNSIS
ncbi:MAG: thiamine phosphate synthase [Alphaproteobacteria bacterium]|nr:thiamine phosphate synthase [Alphaproteobacteria bacterium]